MTKTYELTKLSNKGFVLATEDLDLVNHLLSEYTCDGCMEDIDEVIRDNP